MAELTGSGIFFSPRRVCTVLSDSSEPTLRKKIAIFLPSLAAGGVARVMLQLAQAFVDHGHIVDLVLCRSQGAFGRHVFPPQIRVLELQPRPLLLSRFLILFRNFAAVRILLLPILFARKPPKTLAFLPDLIRYLRKDPPDVLLSAKTHTNLVALWAARMAKASSRIVISERMPLSTITTTSKKWRWRYILPVLVHEYPKADGIISVSNGVKEELILHVGLLPQQITTIYNPVFIQHIREKSLEPIQHLWFQEKGPPIILGVGRLVPAKDFSTLLKAFFRVRRSRPARLVIVGEGRLRSDLTRLAETLGIANDVWMPGFSDNPYAFMSRASVFVLSSIYEGLPNVLLEALACECPIVSTNCSTGPSEILQEGAYGSLIPVGDVDALEKALLSILTTPPPKTLLQARAADFDIQKISRQYLEVLLTPTTRGTRP